MKLKNLSVASFMTGVNKLNSATVKGGIFHRSTDTDNGNCESAFCATWDGNGCHTQGCTADC